MTKVTATFSLWSKVISPERMSEILSAVPDRDVVRGIDRDPPRLVPDAYGWHVKCSDTGEAIVENTLVKLLFRISGFSDKIIYLKKLDQNLDVRISISIRSPREKISLFFTAATMNALAAIGTSFDIDFF